MLPAAETVGFIGRGAAARGRDFCYSCLVRSLAAPLWGCPAPRFSLPRCRDLALSRWLDALDWLSFPLWGAVRGRALRPLRRATCAAVVVEDGARALAAAPRPRGALARGDARAAPNHGRRRAAPS